MRKPQQPHVITHCYDLLDQDAGQLHDRTKQTPDLCFNYGSTWAGPAGQPSRSRVRNAMAARRYVSIFGATKRIVGRRASSALALSICYVVLLPLHKVLNIPRRDQLDVMTESCRHALSDGGQRSPLWPPGSSAERRRTLQLAPAEPCDGTAPSRQPPRQEPEKLSSPDPIR